jgi:hypothetical protein
MHALRHAIALLAAFSAALIAGPSASQESAGVAGSVGASPQVTADPRLSRADADEIEALFALAAQVLASSEFAANLGETAANLDLRMAPDGASVTPGELAEMLRGDRPGIRYAPARVRWRQWGGSNTELDRGQPVIGLKRSIRSLWRSSSARNRACAINSAAHELTHILTARPEGFEWLIADWGYQNTPRSQHFASYTVGSVAQCTWLNQQGGLAGTVGECVLRNGTRSYTPDC